MTVITPILTDMRPSLTDMRPSYITTPNRGYDGQYDGQKGEKQAIDMAFTLVNVGHVGHDGQFLAL